MANGRHHRGTVLADFTVQLDQMSRARRPDGRLAAGIATTTTQSASMARPMNSKTNAST
jgi:hypothetical protein